MIGRLMGIDHGLKRIGIALSDTSGLLARELLILQRTSKREDFARLNQLAEEHDIWAFVVGIPHNDDIPEGVHTQADTVRLWITRFQETTPRPIIQWDEQFTSTDAQQLARLHKRKATAPIDDLAARLILQSYLDAVRDGLATLPPRPNE